MEVSEQKVPGKNKPAFHSLCLQTHSPTFAVLKLEHASVSPGGLVKTDGCVQPLEFLKSESLHF